MKIKIFRWKPPFPVQTSSNMIVWQCVFRRTWPRLRYPKQAGFQQRNSTEIKRMPRRHFGLGNWGELEVVWLLVVGCGWWLWFVVVLWLWLLLCCCCCCCCVVVVVVCCCCCVLGCCGCGCGCGVVVVLLLLLLCGCVCVVVVVGCVLLLCFWPRTSNQRELVGVV